MYRIEICANSVNSAVAAEQGGAYRVELCDNLIEGGTTPSYGSIKLAREKLGIKLNVIIRPRGGDFLYSNQEFEIIKEDVLQCKNLRVDGVVIGFLTTDGVPDIRKTKEICDLAYPMEVTFHRAFDMSRDPMESLKLLKDTSVSRILSSGMANKAIDGMEVLRNMVQESSGKPIIMPGSGIKENNIASIARETTALEFHLSLRKAIPSGMMFKNSDVFMGGNREIKEYEINETDPERVKKVVEILKNL